jgi:hypothetical protein
MLRPVITSTVLGAVVGSVLAAGVVFAWAVRPESPQKVLAVC